MSNYITDAELKAQLSITDGADDIQIALAATAGSRLTDKITGRRFNADTSATVRLFKAETCHRVLIDDALEITAVSIGAGDGTYPTSLTVATHYWTLPLNGVGGDSQTGWPAYALESEGLFTVARRASVQVTAKWGWTAVPDAVKQATMFLAARLFRLRDVPFGMVAGSIDIGPLPVRDIRDAERLLQPYIKVSTTMGIA